MPQLNNKNFIHIVSFQYPRHHVSHLPYCFNSSKGSRLGEIAARITQLATGQVLQPPGWNSSLRCPSLQPLSSDTVLRLTEDTQVCREQPRPERATARPACTQLYLTCQFIPGPEGHYNPLEPQYWDLGPPVTTILRG